MQSRNLVLGLIVHFLFFIPIEARRDFSIEHAITREEKNWGLMGRASMPENHGLLIHYPEKQTVKIWTFNCHFDLTVAFLDENHQIQEIHDLHAFPEKMDSARPVKNLKDLDLYPYSDSVTQFFKSHAIKSKTPISYVLEMNKGWFQKNEVKVDDIVYWDLNKGYIYRK